ncbi:MAG TPA: hypothetical protein VER35_00820 [Candidatus Limnocylindrales bacterium]|nr:hypothetical protein [Candidatus Limnocylindrales bacterium]
MNNKNILSTLFVLLIILFSGCIQQKVAGNETNPNKKIPSGETEKGNDIFYNKTLMFEMKLPSGWKSDVMWQVPYGGLVNFVNDKYPWWPSGDSGAIRLDLETYGTLAIVQGSMDTQLVPIGYTLEYARSQELKREEGITYEGYTKLGGEKAWEIIRKYRTVGDLYQRDINVIHGKRSYVLRFKVISTDVEKRDNITAELEPNFNEIFTSFKFID